jgi:hypothetical protein
MISDETTRVHRAARRRAACPQFRLGGVLFVLLALAGRLSRPFPHISGWGDFVTGTLAIPVDAWLASRETRMGDRLLSGTGRSRPRWPAPLVEPGAIFAHLPALRCRRIALAGRSPPSSRASDRAGRATSHRPCGRRSPPRRAGTDRARNRRIAGSSRFGHAAIGPGQRELSLKRLFGHEHDAQWGALPRRPRRGQERDLARRVTGGRRALRPRVPRRESQKECAGNQRQRCRCSKLVCRKQSLAPVALGDTVG